MNIKQNNNIQQQPSYKKKWGKKNENTNYKKTNNGFDKE